MKFNRIAASASACALIGGVVLAVAAPAQAGIFSALAPKAPEMPAPATLAAPKPIEGNTGKYMSPFTSDGVTAEWITKSLKVKASGQIGAMAGQYAGQKAMENVPFVGGMLGKAAGQKIGREVALKAIGGEEFLKSSSDLSFDSMQDMAVYLYVNYSTHPEYQKILEATWAIYPEFKDAYLPAVLNAPKKS
jgi:hypothetical protein